MARFPLPLRLRRCALLIPVAASLTLTLLAYLSVALAQPTLKDIIGPNESAGEKAAESGPIGTPEDELNRGTPRSAVEAYLDAAREHDYERAAQYLYLGRLPGGLSERDGPRLARQLKLVLDKKLWVDVAALSKKPQGKEEDGQPALRDRVGTIQTAAGSVDILVNRMRQKNGVHIWKFTAVTVAQIPALYEEFGNGPFADILPPFFFETEVAGLQLWQAIGLPAALGLAYLIGLLLTGALLIILRRLPSATTRRTADLAAGPLQLCVSVIALAALEGYLSLPLPVHGALRGAQISLTILAATWIFLRFLDVLTNRLRERLIAHGQASVVPLLPPGRRVARILLLFIAGVMMLKSFGFDVTTLMAGLGVGGIAVALAAQKSIENLFGGATLYADRPVRVGDVCRFGDLVGTVEEIGLRSTRIRTLDRTVVSVPNADFSNLHLDNYSRRDKFWYHPRLGLRYETTPEQIRHILDAVRNMLDGDARVETEPARVRFTNFGAYSLDLDVSAHVKAADYAEYLEIVEDFNLRIMDIVKESGSSFAFPSQTMYIEPGETLPREALEAAQKRLSEWRKPESA